MGGGLGIAGQHQGLSCLSRCLPQQLCWGCTGSWEGTQPARLTPGEQREVSDHGRCPAIRAGGRRREDRQVQSNGIWEVVNQVLLRFTYTRSFRCSRSAVYLSPWLFFYLTLSAIPRGSEQATVQLSCQPGFSHDMHLAEEGKVVAAVFLDFRNAFAAVPHSVLLDKLSTCKMSRYTVPWENCPHGRGSRA